MLYISHSNRMKFQEQPFITAEIHEFSRLGSNELQSAARLPLHMCFDSWPRGGMSHPLLHRDFLSLYITRQGRATHVIDRAPFAVSRGDVYIMGVGSEHRFMDCHDLLTDTLHFSPSIFDWETMQALTNTPGFQALFVRSRMEGDLGGFTSGRWLHLSPDALATVQQMIDELRQEWKRDTPDGILMTQANFVRLLVTLSRLYASESMAEHTAATPAARPHEATVSAAVRHIDAHFMEPLRVDELAAAAHLSADRFTEVFASIMGRTPKEYIRHLRIERAKILLRTTEATMAAVGLDSGIGDAAYFTKVFRTATGMTPSEYRKQAVLSPK